MKRTYLRKSKLHGIPACLSLSLAVAVSLFQQDASAAVLAVNLGAASGFAVLAGAGITVAGAVNSTTITGNIGSFATPSITGPGNVVQHGVNHAGDAVTQQGKLDLGIALADAAGRAPTAVFLLVYDLGGLTLGAGVYHEPSSLGVTGTLTLDAGGDADAVWIFQAGSTLITASGSNISLIGGAQASNVFWQVGSSATLGTGSHFEGSILASESITLNTGASLTGRALAQVGAVTMDNNNIQVPEASGTLLLIAGLGSLSTHRRRTEGALPNFH